jgi:hypothetical protein
MPRIMAAPNEPRTVLRQCSGNPTLRVSQAVGHVVAPGLR